MSSSESDAGRAHMAAAREQWAAWIARGAPGRLRLREHAGTNICDAVYAAGLRGLRDRLRTLCAVLAAPVMLNGWKLFWYRLAGVTIGRNVYIGYGAKLDSLAPWLIALDDGCTLGVDCIVAVHLYQKGEIVLRKIRIGKRAVVGVRAIAFASLGDDATLGPNSVLLANAPAEAVLLGIPAQEV